MARDESSALGIIASGLVGGAAIIWTGIICAWTMTGTPANFLDALSKAPAYAILCLNLSGIVGAAFYALLSSRSEGEE